MNSIDLIKTEIMSLYKTNPHIHVNISLGNPKKIFRNTPAVIKAVYPHVFQLEDCSASSSGCHTFQYVDILTNNIEIIELANSIP